MQKINRRAMLKMGLGLASIPFVKPVTAQAMFFAKKSIKTVIDREVDTCCQFCQVRCTIKVQMSGNKAVGVEANPHNYWTGGTMCPKGKSLAELHYSPERILYPMQKQGDSWVKISYAQALEAVAQAITASKEKRGKDYNHALIFFAPLWNSHESELAALITLDMLGYPNVMSPGDCCISTATTLLSTFLGYSGSTCTIDEIMNAKTLILWGANLAETYPPYAYWLDKAKQAGVKIIFIDPRHTPTDVFASVHIQPKPGTDGALALGLVNALLASNQYDQAYVAENVKNFDVLQKAAASYDLDKTAQLTGLSKETILELADTIAKSPRQIVYMGASLCKYTNGLGTIRAIIGLQAMTNHLLGPGNGLISMQGGKPSGGEEFVSSFHGPTMPKSLNFRRVVAAMQQGKVDILLLSSTYRRYPDCESVKKAIQKVPCVVYRGHFMNEEAELAQIIIPSVMPFESAGSQYGAQRQVCWRQKILDAPGECVDDVQFYLDLGKKLVPDYPNFNSAEDIYQALQSSVSSWKGLTLERVKAAQSGVVWPLYAEDDTERLGSFYSDQKFLTSDGKLDLASSLFGAITWTAPQGSALSKDFPLTFTQGKVAHHWQHTFTNFARQNGLFSHGRQVYLHSKTALKLGLQDKQAVLIQSTVGELDATVELFDGILEDMVFTPSHFCLSTTVSGNHGQPVNQLVPNNWDRISAQLNGFACRVVSKS